MLVLSVSLVTQGRYEGRVRLELTLPPHFPVPLLSSPPHRWSSGTSTLFPSLTSFSSHRADIVAPHSPPSSAFAATSSRRRRLSWPSPNAITPALATAPQPASAEASSA